MGTHGCRHVSEWSVHVADWSGKEKKCITREIRINSITHSTVPENKTKLDLIITRTFFFLVETFSSVVIYAFSNYVPIFIVVNPVETNGSENLY